MAAAAAPAGFSVARALGSHMTLQRAPAAARVWGQDVPGATVRVILSPGDGAAHAGVADAASGVWRVALPPQEAGGPFTLTFNSSSGGSALCDVAFAAAMSMAAPAAPAAGVSRSVVAPAAGCAA